MGFGGGAFPEESQRTLLCPSLAQVEPLERPGAARTAQVTSPLQPEMEEGQATGKVTPAGAQAATNVSPGDSCIGGNSPLMHERGESADFYGILRPSRALRAQGQSADAFATGGSHAGAGHQQLVTSQKRVVMKKRPPKVAPRIVRLLFVAPLNHLPPSAAVLNWPPAAPTHPLRLQPPLLSTLG